jgi:hypothetical protein
MRTQQVQVGIDGRLDKLLKQPFRTLLAEAVRPVSIDCKPVNCGEVLQVPDNHGELAPDQVGIEGTHEPCGNPARMS